MLPIADSSKFDKTSLVKLLDYSGIDYIITDKEPKEDWANLLDSYNIEII